MKKILVLLVVLAAAAAGAYYWLGYGRPVDRGEVSRALVSTGTIAHVVRAIGTLQPIRMVQVGSQVSGSVSKLNVDFNSVVKEGDVLAEIDSTPFEVQVAVQEANIARQDTDIARQKTQLENLQRNLERVQAQYDRGLSSAQQLEAATLQVKTLAAQIAAAEKMKVQAQALLQQARLNLAYCIIRAPVDGVVVNRFVDVGQALQASMRSPNLFMIARDLSTLRLQAGVDEADIGRLRPGLPVTFTVDAYRGQIFHGRVDAVRLNAQNQNGVVTYPIWIEVDNADLRLRPNMTANLQIIVDQVDNAVRVPNDALKFRPTGDVYSWLQLPPPPAGRAPVRLTTESVPEKAPGRSRTAAGDGDVKIDELFQLAPKRVSTSVVWVYEQDHPDPAERLRQVILKTGVSDGTFTEVVSGDIKPGMELVTAVTPPASYFERRTSIFGGPQFRGGGMTPGGEVPLPTLQRGFGREGGRGPGGGPGGPGGGGGRGRG